MFDESLLAHWPSGEIFNVPRSGGSDYLGLPLLGNPVERQLAPSASLMDDPSELSPCRIDQVMSEFEEMRQSTQLSLEEITDPLSTSDPLLGTGGCQVGLATDLSGHLSNRIDSLLQTSWQQAMQQIEAFLSESTVDPLFGPGGDEWLRSQLSEDLMPNVTVLPTTVLQANGAYAASTQIIYLGDLLFQQPASALISVLLEEIGHWVDDRVNAIDTPGDEGAMFATLVQGQALSADQWATLQSENDRGWLSLGDQTLAVEYSQTGVFTATDGTVQIEFLFDGGEANGEIGLYSLNGMDAFVPGSADYTREAARRALSNGPQGAQVFSDVVDGAKFSGQLGEPDWNGGSFAGTQSVTLAPGEDFAFILAPNSTLQAIFDKPEQDKWPALFSIAAANPNGINQFAQLSAGVIAIEDVVLGRGSDADFNDVLFKLSGAIGTLTALAQIVDAQQTWFNLPLTQTIIDDTSRAIVPQLGNFPGDNTFNAIQTAISSDVAKFKSSNSEAEIQASGAQQLTLDGQRIYIGTDQRSANNQDPIIASFGSQSWVNTDYEFTGTDGRGVGLAWTGSNLYAVFTVDGTQGTPEQDFRRKSKNATTLWLRSYGQGGSRKVSVIGQIDLATGELVSAAYLSAILSDGDSNTLTVNDIGTNDEGNLVVQAQSYFAPRQPDGKAMTQVTTGNSPFAYTIEITPDLKRVTKTSAVGWV
ncbi:MAG: DUF4114 domain-containing protein [Cyanobacteria bacterium P01_G01_bin.38]